MERLVAERYRLLAPLGSGGSGTVWRGRDEVLHRQVAVKEVLLPAGLPEAEREQLRERTRREARAAARLDSPHAVTVYDVVEDDGHPFLVMELVDARTLAQHVREHGPLPPRRVAEVGLAVLSALEAAHRQGIVHRDVKPSNVLLRSDGRVVLTDFGIARTTGDASLTSTGTLVGSPSYISPERARGGSPGPASDLWSLGATLFTAVEGRAPYDTGDALTTLTAVVAGEPAPFVHAGPLEPVLTGLLERDPQQRLDAPAARAALEQVAEGTGTTALPVLPAPAAPAAPSSADPAPTGRSRRRLLWLPVAAVLLVAAGVAGWSASTRGTDRSTGTAPGSARPSPAAAAVPAGWATYRGDGWTVRHPAGWEVGSFKGATQLRDPVTHRTVRISTRDGGGSPLALLTTTASSFAASHEGYQQLRLEQSGDGAVWEMTYTDGGAALHALDSAFERGGRGFTAFAQSRAADWPAARDELALVVRSLTTG